jgi:sugar lactone lactonase YvrE
MTVDLVWDAATGVGECPTWDAHNHRLLFADIPAGRIHGFTPATGARATWQLPELLGSFGLCRSGRLIVALRHRVVFYDPVTREITALTDAVDEPASNRLNDGKVAPDGSFWVGSMDTDPARRRTGKLYRVTPDGRITVKSEGYGVSNGLAWSPDGTLMYHSDSSQGFIDVWDHREGEIGNRRLFAQQTPEDGMPDGAAMDELGRYWSAGVTAGCLNVFGHDGHLEDKIALPVTAPTMPCFTPHGVFVTSLIRAGQEATGAGGLYRVPTTLHGATITLFDDTGL